MNFDLFYTSKKPVRLSKKEREKVLELVFRFSQDVDKKIEYFLYHNWDNFFWKISKPNRISLCKKQDIVYRGGFFCGVSRSFIFVAPD
jgi:hypothetical protein